MIEFVFTIDYEIYGNGTGSLEELVYEPASHLQALFRKYAARFVTFVEIAEFEKIEAYGTDKAIDLVRMQIRRLHDEGFEIGFHLHPQWSNARYEHGQWSLDLSEYNLCTLSRSRITEIVDHSLAYLRDVVGQNEFTPLSFRAGNWLFQPTETAAGVLAERGMRIDSSVFQGGLQRNRGMDYRATLGHGYYWPFSRDVSAPDPSGPWVEVPVYTRMVPVWRMFTSKRMAFKNRYGIDEGVFSQKLARARDFLRLRYPMKLDFCRMTLEEMTSMMKRVLENDREQPEVYRPVVAIGHTKDLVDLSSVASLLSYLQENRIKVSTFDEMYRKLGGPSQKKDTTARVCNELELISQPSDPIVHPGKADVMRKEKATAPRGISSVTEKSGPHPQHLRLGLITPARNEADFIEQTIKSVVAQTVRPVHWVIVSDGSTDGTDEIVAAYAAKNDWIELVRLPQRKERSFAGKVNAFNAGCARLADLEYDVVGNLDSDITLDQGHFEFLLNQLSLNSRLGVVGTPFREGRRQYDYRFTSIEHVSGACQLFRRECFEQIGGYRPIKTGGVDLVAVITARMKGWQTRSFPEMTCEHHRMMGTAKHNALAAAFHGGLTDYTHGSDPVWEVCRCLYQMTRWPILVNGSLCMAGYFWGMLSRTEKVVSADFVQFRKAEQMRRLHSFFKHVLPSQLLKHS